jgi:hypothetical protein
MKGHEQESAIDAEGQPLEAPPEAIDAQSQPLEPLTERVEAAPLQKLLYWSGQVYNVGDCTIMDMRIFFWSDGRARFEAHVKSSDNDDVWVFYGGISGLDRNGVTLFTGPKLVGPEMPWEDHWRDMVAEFFYPAIHFDAIAQAQINRMHC